MLKQLNDWLDERTGWPSSLQTALDRPVPGGPRWRHALGFALLASLLVEFVTGGLLMLSYSPSTSTAWASVNYLTHQTDLGWFIRGLHRFGSYSSVIVGALWLLRLALGGLYRAPREVQWWLGVAAFGLILVLGVTGNILPWDQRGYWAAVVETTIAGGTPVVGPTVRRLILGGPDFGTPTLTRIYTLHAIALPALLVLIGWCYSRLFAKVGYPSRDDKPAEPFWPGQAFHHLAAALVVLAALIGLTIARHGYSLDAPADPSSDDYPARPEWYFLALYQLLKVFQGREVIATLVIPGAVSTVLIVLPLLDKVLPRRIAHALACSFVLTLGGCASYLTYQALAKDSHSPSYKIARLKADAIADRARTLADRQGIPPEGSAYVLKLDPLHRGVEIFNAKCQGCHNLGAAKSPEQWAPDLKDYGSYAWIRGLLENPDSPSYFGKAPMCGGMKEWKEGSKLKGRELDAVASFVAEFAKVPPDVTPAEWLDDAKVKDHPGRALYMKDCAECHTMGDPGSKGKKLQAAPDLFAWGSDRWTARMIQAPSADRFYGYLEEDHDQKMPAFGPQLTETDIGTLVRYLKGDYLKPSAPAAP